MTSGEGTKDGGVTNLDDLIHLLMTGGTIDSVFDGAKDAVVALPESVVPAYFARIGMGDLVVPTTICLRQSTEITDTERARLTVSILGSPARRFIVTHGLYTIADTGIYLNNNPMGRIAETGKTVVLTGSRFPLRDVAFSDAPFQLGFAVGIIKGLEPGVYIALDGRVHKPEEYKPLQPQG